MLSKSEEEAKITECNCDGADDDFQDSSDEDALLEIYTSSNELEMKYNEDGNVAWCT